MNAARSIEIGTELQERHGYPALSAEIKRKVFGLNGARVYGLDLAKLAPRLKKDRVQKARLDYAPLADPSFETCGPKTRREFLALRRMDPLGPV